MSYDDDIDYFISLVSRSAYRLARFRSLNAPECFIRKEVRMLYKRKRVVAKLMLRNVARCN